MLVRGAGPAVNHIRLTNSKQQQAHQFSVELNGEKSTALHLFLKIYFTWIYYCSLHFKLTLKVQINKRINRTILCVVDINIIITLGVNRPLIHCQVQSLWQTCVLDGSRWRRWSSSCEMEHRQWKKRHQIIVLRRIRWTLSDGCWMWRWSQKRQHI